MGPPRLQGESGDAMGKSMDDQFGVGLITGAVTPWAYASSGNIRAEHRSEVVDAFGKWVDGLGDWQWFVTRTLGRPVDVGFTQPGAGTARRCLRDLLVRTRARRFVCVFEMQSRGVPHLHALLETASAISGGVEQERDYNKWGIARWKIFRRGAGASYYLGKYLGKELIELYVGLDGPWSEGDLAGRKLAKLRC